MAHSHLVTHSPEFKFRLYISLLFIIEFWVRLQLAMTLYSKLGYVSLYKSNILKFETSFAPVVVRASYNYWSETDFSGARLLNFLVTTNFKH